MIYVDTKNIKYSNLFGVMQIQITRDPKKVEDDSLKMKTAFSGKAPRGNKEKISTLIRLMTENSTIIKTKFTPSLTSNDTNISR